MNQEKFDLWCVVELFGHAKIAGKCTEQNIAGTNMLRVDVPETTRQPAFTRFFGAGAIYAINPVDEETARFHAERLELAPIVSWQISDLVKKHNALILEGNNIGKALAGDIQESEFEEDDDHRDDY